MSCSITREKKAKIISHWKCCLFSKNCVFYNLSGPKKRSYDFDSKCQTSLWTLINGFLRFVRLDKARKDGVKNFCQGDNSYFWNVSFYRLLRSQRIYLIICTKFVKGILNPLLNLPCPLCCSKMREELGRNFFWTGKATIFSKVCVLNNLIGPRELVLIFPQLISNYLVDTSKSSLRFVILDKTRQNRLKLFSSLERLLFFQKFVFSSTSQVANEWS